MIDLHLTVEKVRKVQDVGPGEDEHDTTWTYKLAAPVGSSLTLKSSEKLPIVAGDTVRVRIDGATQTQLDDHADPAAPAPVDDSAVVEAVAKGVRRKMKGAK